MIAHDIDRSLAEAGEVAGALALPAPVLDKGGLIVLGGMSISPEVWMLGLFAFHLRLARKLAPASLPVPLDCFEPGPVARALNRAVEVRGMLARIALVDDEDGHIRQCVEGGHQIFPTNSHDWRMLCALAKRVLRA